MPARIVVTSYVCARDGDRARRVDHAVHDEVGGEADDEHDEEREQRVLRALAPLVGEQPAHERVVGLRAGRAVRVARQRGDVQRGHRDEAERVEREQREQRAVEDAERDAEANAGVQGAPTDEGGAERARDVE